MKFIPSAFTLIALLGAGFIHAQNETDALRYSFQTYGGSARSYGVGGAMGAIGADYACASINPAGLARFRKSSASFSAAFYNSRNNAEYISNTNSDSKFNFNLPNLNLIVNIAGEDYQNKKPKGFVNFTIGFNMNRLNNFHNNTTFDGTNTFSSITQNWADRANATNTTPVNFSAYSLELLAYNAWLIDKDTSSPSIPRYKSAYGNNPINVNQYGYIQNKGAINDYNLSFAANYMHMVYFGATLGFKSVRFIQSYDFNEVDKKTANVQDISKLNMNQYLRTTGNGLNAKVGVNFAPNEYLRFGIAYHSPTTYNLKDSYSYAITSAFDFGATDPFGDYRESKTVKTPASTYYKYKITSPARTIFSVGLVNKEVGFLSLDIETVNYSGAKISPTKQNASDYGFSPENQTIRKISNANAVNVRFGAEYIYEDFRFRGGYAYYASPYKSDAFKYASDLNTKVYSLGFGIKKSNYAFDVAYVISKTTTIDVPYTLVSGFSYAITNNIRSNNLVFSVSFPID